MYCGEPLCVTIIVKSIASYACFIGIYIVADKTLCHHCVLVFVLWLQSSVSLLRREPRVYCSIVEYCEGSGFSGKYSTREGSNLEECFGAAATEPVDAKAGQQIG